jgi:4-amino-4-deoxy-L-arabinose transferase-like glycosyltransferase
MSRLVPVLNRDECVYGRILLAGLTATGYLTGPSIFSDRLWSFCMMLLALTIYWHIARRLLGACWGLAAVMLCLAEPMFFGFSHTPRPEMTMCVLFLSASYSGLKAMERNAALWFFLAGLLGSFAIDVHLSGVILAPAIGLAIIFLKGRAILRERRMLWFAVGVATGFLGYICWHILPNPRLFFEQMSYYSVKEGFSANGFQSLMERAAKEFHRYMFWFWGSDLQRIPLIEAVLISAGLVYSARSKNLRTRYLSLVAISLVLVQAFLVYRKVVYYLMPIYPLFVFHSVVALRAFYMAGKARSLGRNPGGRILRALALSGIIALAGFYIVQELIKVYRNRNTNYEMYVSEITSAVPPGTVVAGSPSLWYALGNRNDLIAHVSFLWTLKYGYRGRADSPQIADIVETNKIQIIIVEPYFRKLLESQDGASERSIREFLQTHCRWIKSFRSTGYRGIGECKEGEVTQIYAVMHLP